MNFFYFVLHYSILHRKSDVASFQPTNLAINSRYYLSTFIHFALFKAGGQLGSMQATEVSFSVPKKGSNVLIPYTYFGYNA